MYPQKVHHFTKFCYSIRYTRFDIVRQHFSYQSEDIYKCFVHLLLIRKKASPKKYHGICHDGVLISSTKLALIAIAILNKHDHQQNFTYFLIKAPVFHSSLKQINYVCNIIISINIFLYFCHPY